MPTSETTRPPQDEASVPEALRAACERLGEVADAYEKAEPDWLGHALLDQVRLGLDNLRRYIDDPDEDRISWDFPFVELTYPVEWDFEGRLHPPPGGVVFGTFTAEDVVDGKVSEEKVLEVLYETRQLEALSRLTRRVVEWREAGKTDAEGRPAYILPQDLVAWLDETTGTTSTEKGVEGPPEAVEARRRLVDHLARPFSVGAFEAEAAVADAKLDAPNPAELEAPCPTLLVAGEAETAVRPSNATQASLMAHAVAAASCDPNNASKHYWECGADSVREALTPAAVRRLWDELELVTVETSATRAEATEGDRERLARLLRGRRWRSFAGNAPSGKVTRLLKVIRFALEEIESANAAE